MSDHIEIKNHDCHPLKHSGTYVYHLPWHWQGLRILLPHKIPSGLIWFSGQIQILPQLIGLYSEASVTSVKQKLRFYTLFRLFILVINQRDTQNFVLH